MNPGTQQNQFCEDIHGSNYLPLKHVRAQIMDFSSQFQNQDKQKYIKHKPTRNKLLQHTVQKLGIKTKQIKHKLTKPTRR